MANKFPVNSSQEDELVTQLYKKASSEEPGADLDVAILSQARKAISEQSASPKLTGFYRWQRFSSIAATFVVVVTVGMLYQTNKTSLTPEESLKIESSSIQTVPNEQRENSSTFEDLEEDEVAAKVVSSPPSTSVKEQLPRSEPVVESAPREYKLTSKKTVSSKDTKVHNAPMPALQEETEASGQLEPAKPEEAALRAAPGFSRLLAPKAKILEEKREQDVEVDSDDRSVSQRLAHIRSLVKAGDYGQAEKEWQLFIKQHPDYSGAEDLAELFGS
ncbi:MAG: hypothetical protein MI976_25205 [Pseudomonadales bacterium]|nr:hypothetical protein [Pseudomonadales bacterium]